MDSQSSSMSATVESRVFSHKRRRNGTFKLEESTGDLSGCCTTSGESSSDESDSGVEVEDFAEEEEAQAAAKRRRRAELDGLKKSVREVEAQVVNASSQLRDLAALVAQVVAQRQQQSQHRHA